MPSSWCVNSKRWQSFYFVLQSSKHWIYVEFSGILTLCSSSWANITCCEWLMLRISRYAPQNTDKFCEKELYGTEGFTESQAAHTTHNLLTLQYYPLVLHRSFFFTYASFPVFQYKIFIVFTFVLEKEIITSRLYYMNKS